MKKYTQTRCEQDAMDEHEIIRKEAIEEQPAEDTSSWKEATILGSGILLLLLILFYFTLSESLIGIIGSSKLEGEELRAGNITIEFSEGTLEELQQHYAENEHREIKACLLGEAHEQKYKVSEIYFPEVYDANVVHISAETCPAGTIIDLHSHPVNKCSASEQDIEVFKKLKKTRPELLMAIMCSTHRFHIYQNT